MRIVYGPKRNGEWIVVRTSAGRVQVELGLNLIRGASINPVLMIESAEAGISGEEIAAPELILREIAAGLERGNQDFGTEFGAASARCSIHGTTRISAYRHLAYRIVEAGFWETGRHRTPPPLPADGSIDLRLPAHRLAVLEEFRSSWPSHGKLRYAFDQLWLAIVQSIRAHAGIVGCEPPWPRVGASRTSVAAVELLAGEVSNGGFDQYLTNSSGSEAREALAGLVLIGAKKHAAVLERALSRFPGGAPPRDLDERVEVLDRLDLGGSWWSEFDEPFDECDTTENLQELLVKHVAEHAGDFFAL